MTDNKSENSQASDTATATSGPEAAATPGTPTSAPSTANTGRGPMWAFGAVLIIALLLAVALWYQQENFKNANAQLAEQTQRSLVLADQANEQARQALSLINQQSTQLQALETSARDARSHAERLEQAFQTLTESGSDLVLVNDVDHLVTIAQQQLQLSGNVGNAIISLETAQAQLARANRPGLASLQQTINGDLERLRAASTVDVAMLSTELDELAALVAQAPLMVPDDVAPDPSRQGDVPTDAQAATPGAEAPSELPANAPWWRKGLHAATSWSTDAWAAIRQDLGEFIVVRRADDPIALLMSPDQATRFRESMGSRIMTAQLALMMRQPKIWHAEIGSLIKALETRYDGNDPRTQQALKLVRRLADTRIDTKLPTVDNSLKAIEAVREANIKATQDGALEQALHSDNGGTTQEGKAGHEANSTEQEAGQATAPETTSEADAPEDVSPPQEPMGQPAAPSAPEAPVEQNDGADAVQQQSEPAPVPGASPTTPQE